MKKKQLLMFAMLFATTLISTIASAKGGGDGSFDKGTISVTAGYGYGLAGSLFSAYDSYSDYTFSKLGPITARIEYGVSKKIGLGLSVNYSSYNVEWKQPGVYPSPSTTLYKAGFKGVGYSALLRMNLHFANGEKIDPYWGFGLGYRGGSYTFSSDDSHALNQSVKTLIPVGFETTIGLRYYFTPNIGAYAEVGLGKALAQVGVAFKF